MVVASQQPGRSPKGTVKIKTSNGRLQLVFSQGGKRHYLSLGLPDSKINRQAATAKAKLIESDIAFDRFDTTLDKYKPQSALSVVTPITPSEVSLMKLWEDFMEYKRPQCSPNTMKYMYGPFTNYVKRLPTHKLDDAAQIRDWVVKNIPLESGKRFITRLSACCRWAISSGVVTEDPFKDMAAEIKVPKSAKSEGFTEINPFSLEERDAIIDAIASDRFCPKASGYKHSRYAPLINFLFSTGCRPSEAVALQWKHISKDLRTITFQQVVIGTNEGRRIRQGLKTQEYRKFPCNTTLQGLLKSIRPEERVADALVFPSPENRSIDLNNFRNRTWKKVLKGLGLEYRKLYQCRHTFITLALEHGLDAKDVARLVGNSPEIIYRYNAGNQRALVVPEFRLPYP